MPILDDDQVLKETKRTIVIERDGRKLYVCKYCKDFETEESFHIGGHLKRRKDGSIDCPDFEGDPPEVDPIPIHTEILPSDPISPPPIDPQEESEIPHTPSISSTETPPELESVHSKALMKEYRVPKSDPTPVQPEVPLQRDLPKRSSKPLPVPTRQDFSSVLTPDEEMLKEMVDIFQQQLEMAPGVTKNKITWMIEYFKKTELMQRDARALYAILQRNFPKAEDETINFIVDQVFEVRNQYNRRRTGYDGSSSRYGSRQRGDSFQRDRGGEYQDRHNDGGPLTPDSIGRALEPMFARFFDLQRNDQVAEALKIIGERLVSIESGGGKGNSNVTAEDVAKIVNESTEKTLLVLQNDKLMEALKDQRDLIEEISRSKNVSGDNWNDDGVRAFATMGSQVIQGVEKIITAQKTNRGVILEHLGSYMFGPSGKRRQDLDIETTGETDQGLLELLPEEYQVEN